MRYGRWGIDIPPPDYDPPSPPTPGEVAAEINRARGKAIERMSEAVQLCDKIGFDPQTILNLVRNPQEN